MLHPAFTEALILGVMGVSGIGVGLLLGIRTWIPLAFAALAASTVLRVWTAFSVWSLGKPEWSFEVWLGASLVVTVIAFIVKRSFLREAASATALFVLGSLVALATKYLFDIGERHHSDSANVLSLAIVAIQGDMADLDPISGNFKRGIAYPLMLALGPEGRILGSFTPLLYLSVLLVTGWLAWRLVGEKAGWKIFALISSAIAIYSLTVPMFRAAMFYLNGHTLMGLAIALLLAGIMVAREQHRFSELAMALVVLGGIVGATARIEGIVLVLVLLVALVDQQWWSDGIDRVRLFAALGLIGLSLTWWLGSLNSPVLDRFSLSVGVMVGITILGAAIAASPLIDRARGWFLPSLGVALIGLLGYTVWQSNDPVGMLLAQWPNLGLGRGGWATAAHVFIGSAILLGLRRRTSDYRLLLGLAIMLIGSILFTKTFDGGFGREGFYDSVNRMWLHVMPVILVSALVGYAELVASAARRKRKADQHIDARANTTA